MQLNRAGKEIMKLMMDKKDKRGLIIIIIIITQYIKKHLKEDSACSCCVGIQREAKDVS